MLLADVPPLPTKSEEPVTSLLVNNPCLRPPMIAEKDQANSGLIQANTTVPPSEKSPDNKFPSVQTSHHTVKEHGVLPESTVTELMAATGLSPQEIHLWAASLPAGSTVKVTHHFSSEPTAIKVKDKLRKNQPFPKIKSFLISACILSYYGNRKEVNRLVQCLNHTTRAYWKENDYLRQWVTG